MTALPFHRTLKIGCFGWDVSAAKRAVYRYLNNGQKWTGYLNQSQVSRRTFGPWFREDLVLAQDQLTAGRKRGELDQDTLRALEDAGAFDRIARVLWLRQYPAPVPPALIEPRQGFDSLTRDLWEAYSIGRRMGLTDLGTYNPGSRLPSGHASDHATSRLDGRIGEPACAFDLGFTPAVGTGNPVANKFFHLMVNRPGIAYVICGRSIWSVEKGLHAYTYGGHEGHVHTSGHRR